MNNVFWFFSGVMLTIGISWWIAGRAVKRLVPALSAELREKSRELSAAQHCFLRELASSIAIEIIRRDYHAYSRLMRILRRFYVDSSALSKINFEKTRQKKLNDLLEEFPDIDDFNPTPNLLVCPAPTSRFTYTDDDELIDRFKKIMTFMFWTSDYRHDEAIDYWLSEGFEAVENREFVKEIKQAKVEFESHGDLVWLNGCARVGSRLFELRDSPFGETITFNYRRNVDPSVRTEEHELWVCLGWEECTPEAKTFVTYFKKINGVDESLYD